MIGNSSSGLTEVPSFYKGTINIGDRQRGRLKAASVIHCKPIKNAISRAIAKLFSEEFQAQLKTTINPYGTGGASDAIVKTLETKDFSNLLKKKFYDIDIS